MPVKYRNYRSPYDDREELKRKAREHTEEMDAKYPEEIRSCIENSVIYGGPDKRPARKGEKVEPRFFFVNVDSIFAISLGRGKTAVLNFASYKNPGGRFYDGSKAQEEMLCHNSYLYNVLRAFPQYYEWNSKHNNNALYRSRAIYTPNVRFDKRVCDVITCAAPNLAPAIKYETVALKENDRVLQDRIAFVRDVAEDNEVKTIILGAYGCGVFKQDPVKVATLIKEIFSDTTIENIVIPVPGTDKNFEAFKEVFGEPKKIRQTTH